MKYTCRRLLSYFHQCRGGGGGLRCFSLLDLEIDIRVDVVFFGSLYGVVLGGTRRVWREGLRFA